MDFEKYERVIDKDHVKYYGKVSQIVGLTIESTGPQATMGEVCKIYTEEKHILAEVVGFKSKNLLLMPLGDMQGVGPGNLVEATGEIFKINICDNILGRVLDGLGRPIDDLGDISHEVQCSVLNDCPTPLKRNRITKPLELGVKAIDGMLTVGKGQRIGIFAGSGVGKSTLLGMIARNAVADVNVIALIGERGREVREFIEKDLQEEGLKRSVVVVATSDQPSLIRLKAAYVATSIAEHFRGQGKDVALMLDSLTRFSMAQREVGLAVGEPPVSKGYTPSVFTTMPKLLERAGNSDKGSITGIYTVLVEGDDMSEPVSDTARSILDGHIVLSRSLAHKNHYPSIDILQSISRVMSDVVTPEQKELSNNIKKIMAIYKEAEDLINIGAYVKGSNKEIDYAIAKIGKANEFLTQRVEENFTLFETLEIMSGIFKD
ncbi:MAG TPA: flagellar protein export ATPase FliI [Clostridiales bacterium]|nr:MAG: flagellar protein export ATPase FliI [Clostridiales bacterium GWD2_32_59]HAN10024.1 flagellar protein export ATPase FliI [Clostridiales bacterium]